ncbi:MAG: coenzyme F420-0:L-glutamate ligase [Actinomycetota bacterium]|nr:coenzyme F420-0:L-glutamate ligase [Actinomycetota bacterium]
MISLIPILGLPEFEYGMNIGDEIVKKIDLITNDVVVVTSKVVSKVEGRLVPSNSRDEFEKNVIAESRRILRRRGEMMIVETNHGFVCANAGIDQSNVPSGQIALLPKDSDRSARRIRDQIQAISGTKVGIIVSDTFGRAWRRGVTDVALGVAGVAAIIDLRGSLDANNRELKVTEVAVADEIASAAELVKGKAANVAAVLVRGVDSSYFRESSVAEEIVRVPSEDLFR